MKFCSQSHIKVDVFHFVLKLQVDEVHLVFKKFPLRLDQNKAITGSYFNLFLVRSILFFSSLIAFRLYVICFSIECKLVNEVYTSFKAFD